ncbi:hypothetical protein [Chitinophaga silvisoli]|uniref:Uncharacterized protein n=1 Tax=Chitinophaga silvisoli TaxID=2291814 RepID=A0A3E1P2U7_9BACT|nr:hypothetical protein [Chitinophaga silvisoli]RFM34485.1 hypothetical protein DXN04_14510 [Chitinophaga silvisoli]
MKNRFLHKILAILLLGVFTFNTTPREFIHQVFMDHHDTKDAPVTHDGLAFSTKHTHCQFLHLEPEPYQHTSTFFAVLEQAVLWRYAGPVMPAIMHGDYRMLSPRAPPAIAFL